MPHIDTNSVLWKEVDGQVIVLMISSGAFVELNKTGSFIWKQLVEGKNPDEIVVNMASTFDAPREKLSTDVSQFITSMVSQGLLSK